MREGKQTSSQYDCSVANKTVTIVATQAILRGSHGIDDIAPPRYSCSGSGQCGLPLKGLGCPYPTKAAH